MYIKYFTSFNQHLKTKCQALNTRSSNSVCGGIAYENFTDLLCFCKHKKFWVYQTSIRNVWKNGFSR